MVGSKRATEAGGKQEVIVWRPADLRKHTRVNMAERRLNDVHCLWRVRRGEEGGSSTSSSRSCDVGSQRCPLPLRAVSVHFIA